MSTSSTLRCSFWMVALFSQAGGSWREFVDDLAVAPEDDFAAEEAVLFQSGGDAGFDAGVDFLSELNNFVRRHRHAPYK